MAEIVGAVASTLTLLDSTVKTLNLISDFQNVPSTVRALTTQARQLEEVLKSIQSNDSLDPNSEPLQSTLQDCKTDLSTFHGRLRALAQHLNGKKIPRTWGFVKGVVKLKEFEEAATKIDRHKTTLLLCLQNHNLFVAVCTAEL